MKLVTRLPDFKNAMISFEDGWYRVYTDKDDPGMKDDLKANVMDRWFKGEPHWYWSVPADSSGDMLAFAERHHNTLTMTRAAAKAMGYVEVPGDTASTPTPKKGGKPKASRPRQTCPTCHGSGWVNE